MYANFEGLPRYYRVIMTIYTTNSYLSRWTNSKREKEGGKEKERKERQKFLRGSVELPTRTAIIDAVVAGYVYILVSCS